MPQKSEKITSRSSQTLSLQCLGFHNHNQIKIDNHILKMKETSTEAPCMSFFMPLMLTKEYILQISNVVDIISMLSYCYFHGPALAHALPPEHKNSNPYLILHSCCLQSFAFKQIHFQ